MSNQVLSDRYEIIEEIGQGAMGVVYRARHRLMKRLVAIKMLHESLVANQLARKRFEHEAQAISSLNHPNIMSVYDFGIADDGKPYLVVEFLQGIDLEALGKDIGSLPVSRAVPIFKQACAGLAHAHNIGVVHRDIKPSNFMLVKVDGQEDFVKIVDFGIAKLAQGQSGGVGLTTTGEIFGSPLYMSPEQCCGHQVDARSDIYSLGCVMYRTLTGCPAFTAANVPECLYKHVHEQPLPFAEVSPGLPLPETLEAIVLKAMRKELDRRFQSMTELRKALEAFEMGATTLEPAISAPGEQSAELPLHAAPLPPSAPASPSPPAEPSPSAPSVLESDSAPHAASMPDGAQAPEGAPVATDGAVSKSIAPEAQRQAGEPVGPAASTASTQPSGQPTKKKKYAKIAAIGAAVAAVAAAGSMGLMSLLGGQPAQTFSTSYRQGTTDFQQGLYAEAEKSFAVALQAAHQMPAPAGYLSIEQAAEHLAKTYSAEGKYDELTTLAIQEQRFATATAMLNEALGREQEKHGPASPQVATICANLARLYEKQSEYAKAEMFYTRALNIRSGKAASAGAASPVTNTKEIETHLASVKQLQATTTTPEKNPPVQPPASASKPQAVRPPQQMGATKPPAPRQLKTTRTQQAKLTPKQQKEAQLLQEKSKKLQEKSLKLAEKNRKQQEKLQQQQAKLKQQQAAVKKGTPSQKPPAKAAEKPKDSGFFKSVGRGFKKTFDFFVPRDKSENKK